MIAKSVAGKSVHSTINYYFRRKYSRAAFLALIASHAGDTKYHAIVKSSNNLLQNIKWNAKNCPFEQHVLNHLTAIDNLRFFATHIGNAVTNTPQRVEFLLESIASQVNSIQAAMGNIWAETNILRSDFEGASSHLIEVDPYWRSTKSNTTKPNPAKVSAVTFAGRGKPEWTFVGIIDSNLVISPMSRIINLRPIQVTMKAKTP